MKVKIKERDQDKINKTFLTITREILLFHKSHLGADKIKIMRDKIRLETEFVKIVYQK